MAQPEPRGSGTDGLPPSESKWRLWYDLAWAHALLWFVTFGQPVTPLPGVHLYFADRYGLLAACYGREGRIEKAERYWERAIWHWDEAGPDPEEPLPPAVEMAMPVPQAPSFTDARVGDAWRNTGPLRPVSGSPSALGPLLPSGM